MKRIQRKRTKGWRMPENTKYVGRPTKFGNPFKLTIDGYILYYKHGKLIGSPWCYLNDLPGYTLQAVVDLYRDWITGGFEYKGIQKALPPIPNIEELRGSDLACFCPLSAPCHIDVLIELLESNTTK